MTGFPDRNFDEKPLLLRLSQNDPRALEEIYLYFWQRLFISCYNVIKDRAASEDIVQEVFISLWSRRENIYIKESLHAYLTTAVKYQVFRHIRNNPSKKYFFENLSEKLQERSPDLDIQTKDLNNLIENVVDTLPDKCRFVYKLSREYQLSHKEIAERLHISPKTVENQLTIALKKLRSSLTRLAVFFFF